MKSETIADGCPNEFRKEALVQIPGRMCEGAPGGIADENLRGDSEKVLEELISGILWGTSEGTPKRIP